MKINYDDIDIKQFTENFGKIYDFLYKYELTDSVLANMFDDFNKLDKFNKFVCKSNDYRKDFVSSDREAAAFVLSLLFSLVTELGEENKDE